LHPPKTTLLVVKDHSSVLERILAWYKYFFGDSDVLLSFGESGLSSRMKGVVWFPEKDIVEF